MVLPRFFDADLVLTVNLCPRFVYAASLLLSMNSNKANKANFKTQKSDSSPGQPRSIRPRLYL